MPEIGPLLGSGRVAEAFAYGAHVLKLYRDPAARAAAFAEAATLAIVADHRLPTPLVFEAGNYAGRWGLVMSRAPGRPLGELALADPTLTPTALDEMVRLQLAVHARTETRLRPLNSRLAATIARAPYLDPGQTGALLAHLTTLPDGDRLCHGDFHPLNLIGLPGATVIVDWPDATSGPPAADACRSYLLLALAVPLLAGAYLDRYVAAGRLTRDDILAWLPLLAAARLTEGGDASEVAQLLQLGSW